MTVEQQPLEMFAEKDLLLTDVPLTKDTQEHPFRDNAVVLFLTFVPGVALAVLLSFIPFITDHLNQSKALGLLVGAVRLIVGYAGVGRKLVVSYKNRVQGKHQVAWDAVEASFRENFVGSPS